MTKITYEQLKQHRDRAWEMGNKRAMDILTDFMDIQEKGLLTQRQCQYAESLFEATSEQALQDFKEYIYKIEVDEKYREKIRVVSEYYRQTHYHRDTAIAALRFLKGNSEMPPPFRDMRRMVYNEYAENVWVSHKADPKFQAGDLVRLRANVFVGYTESKVDSWMVIAVGSKPINTSHVYNESTGGTKRYDLLEVGGSTIITVMEKQLKKHRVPKTKKRT